MARKLVVVAALLQLVQIAHGHSWVACTDYRMSTQSDEDYFNPNACYAYARDFRYYYGGGHTFGGDVGFNFQGSACRDPIRNPLSDSYSSTYPMAQYTAGQTVCLAWPAKNHAAASCTNQYIEDNGLKVLAFRQSGTSFVNPTQSQFDQNVIRDWTGEHVNGVIDFKGFQNCPKFCENTDKALCHQCFTLPSFLAPGTYTFQWWWVFNRNDAPYISCWDATVAAPAATTAVPVTTGARPVTTGVPAGTTGPRVTTGAGSGNTGDSCDSFSICKDACGPDNYVVQCTCGVNGETIVGCEPVEENAAEAATPVVAATVIGAAAATLM